MLPGKRSLFMLLAALLLPALLAAQTAASELAKLRKAYESASDISMEIDVYVHKSRNDKKGSLLGTGTMKKSGESYYSKFMDDELVSNKNCTVILDHYDRSITYLEGTGKKHKESFMQSIDAEAIIKMSDSVIYKGAKNGYIELSFLSPNTAVVQTDILIDPKTYFIKKITYYYAEANEEETYDMSIVVVDYRSVSTSKIGNTHFSESRYVNKKGGKLVASEAYKKYKLIIAGKEKL